MISRLQSSVTTMSPEDQEVVREQVGRILSSVLFRNSKRFPAFLRFTVEHALESGDALKERTIGHEVFGRSPDYDTAQDPIVRMTAAEVRKRLGQYYQTPEHAGQVVISYQPGSYLPEFEWPESNGSSAPLTAPLPGPLLEELPREAQPPARKHFGVVFLLATAVVVLSLALGVALVRKPPSVPASDAVAHFWSPLIAAAEPVLLCIGDLSRAGEQDPSAAIHRDDLTIDGFLQQANSVRFTDSVTLALLAGELRARSKPFRIRRPASTEFKDLRDGPVILIGGFNNPWTLRLSEGLRFTLTNDVDGPYIRDASHPDSREWRTPPRSTRLKDLSKTFGLITRIKDPQTGHMVMIVSGLVLGTRGAAECLIDPQCLEAAERTTGADWDQKNVQMVISTTVVGEDSGAPQVLSTHVW